MRATDKSVFRISGPPELPAAPDLVIEALVPLVTPERLGRIRAVVEQRTLDVVPVVDNIADPHNASAILRTADALGIQRVHVVANDRPFMGSHKVAKGTERWLDLVWHPTPEDCADALHAEGYEVFVASMDGDHTPEDLAGKKRVSVVFGNEHRGASKGLRERADGTYRIPMVGFVESLNVSVAAAITMYTLSRSSDRRVDGERRRWLEARYLMSTVTDAEAYVNAHVEALRKQGRSE
ncbi:MAG: RNA methyltransferase [Polyangiales bacterium]